MPEGILSWKKALLGQPEVNAFNIEIMRLLAVFAHDRALTGLKIFILEYGKEKVKVEVPCYVRTVCKREA